MSWGIFDGADTDEGAPTLHVAPVDEYELVAAGHVITATCPCNPSRILVAREPGDPRPAMLYSHSEPTWPGAVRTDDVAQRTVAALRRPRPS